ncbi:MAG: SUF system NifU family Fe-S cluster assembly protein [Deltaproteobacteria bacterium RIFCSPLOWO2_02_FULL_50_16]|nr:MAG: SUF system NifU family Fe-S cluster assembly protein [Deltaproteobacteria bacterium GWA2_50_8]OGQ27537.1 MAG: SUF system NifU family Fe-S cluster assembly protein [Deltaproteobacteria bacterium RIFCSPHIGHO2_02_FULL_50_15]OGQ56444.1 MAG: SUF system NifU family Fe-S cluster assembly protein [Deltaproteobacteria bacterium RIFCSPLOWO2_02_FULL_50_16]OGQ66847.1 MAG: SUF system NifU family Fe-S cluster assembly protein [Deltaproteobacteria bacterium RIFCSPLOWO2_12_FULL_50_11]
MTPLSELYQQVILDHNSHPQNFHKLENADGSAEGYNPLCGDEIHIYLKMEGEKIQDIGFLGSGCAISKASTSIMTASIKGKTKAEAKVIFQKFIKMITSPLEDSSPDPDLGKLSVFKGVREFPTRIKCASLAWHTLQAALENKNKTVTTEEESDPHG